MMYISYIGRCIYLCVLVLHKVCYNNDSSCNVITSLVHQIVCYHREDGVVKVVLLWYIIMAV